MLPYKTERFETSAPHLDTIQSELDRWKNLVFSFDMEDDQHLHNHPNSQNTRNPSDPTGQPTDIQDALLLAQFATASQNAGGQNYLHNPTAPPRDAPSMAVLQALQTLQRHGFPTMNLPHNASMLHGGEQQRQGPHPFMPPSFHGDMNAQRMPDLSSGQMHFDQSRDNMYSNDFSHIFNDNYPHANTQASSSNTTPNTVSQPVASTSTAGSPPVEEVSDDKRRRNTAASARFRIKKKQRAINLERSVTDLTGRAEELEREAADLRRENGWLKEIIMLKGSKLQLTPDTVSSSMWDGRQTSAQNAGSDDGGGESSDSEYTEDRKGKGKAKARSRKK